MLDEMRVNDEQLDASDIRRLENADEIAHFFARLRYDVDARTNIPDYAALGMGSEDMRQHISKIELLGQDPEDGDISIYLFEVRSVTAKLRNDIARRFRERPENALLVLTKDYEALEFVMLERVLSRSQSRRAALKQAIRPIPLMVNRLHPNPVALRVLKRFTFTEEDAVYQWEKLRSAYMLAEWSEEYFNNRALFSDYYLKERLTDPKITPAWDEDVRPAGREIYKHIVTARKNYTRQTEDVIRKGLYEPVFKLLGFDFKKQRSRTSSAGQADYLFYTPGDTLKPIAAALTYVWNRNLDDVDEARECREDDGGTPFEIPGARVVSLLEAQVTPWVIVTNGKLWRLYSSTASNKATNYYEIDLSLSAGRLRRPVLVLDIDGASGATRPDSARESQEGRRHTRAKRARWRGQGRDAKGLRFSLLDGARIGHVRSWHHVHNEEQLGEALTQMKEAGLMPADQVRLCVVCDGAEWLWQHVQALLPQARQGLDDSHCAPYLHRVAKAHEGASVQA